MYVRTLQVVQAHHGGGRVVQGEGEAGAPPLGEEGRVLGERERGGRGRRDRGGRGGAPGRGEDPRGGRRDRQTEEGQQGGVCMCFTIVQMENVCWVDSMHGVQQVLDYT